MYYIIVSPILDSDYGIIIGLTVTPGDVHDTVPYLAQLEALHQTVIPLKAAAADSAYDFPLEHQELEELGIAFFVWPQPVHDRTQAEFKRKAFSYQPDQDVYLCPQGKILTRKGLYRSASGLLWQYQAEKADCICCPVRDKCLSEYNRRGARKLEDNYFKPAVQRSRSRRKTDEYRQALKKRQVWCEGAFAIQKRCHNLTQLLWRGFEAAEAHCLLSATAMDLKQMIKHLT